MPKVVHLERVKKLNEFRLKIQKAGFPTLKSLSDYLGVSYHHLTEVLLGNRKSRRLMKRIKEAIKNGRKAK
jgi:hypothetical protein